MTTTTARRPRIGITLDYETTDSYSRYPWYALREHYTEAVSEAGGVPLPLPHEVDCVEAYLELIDGLVITGGDFDVPPEMYGQEQLSDEVLVKHKRSVFEHRITREAIDRQMPMLGICGGQQLLNVVLGGSLIQHIPDRITSEIEHEQPNPRHEVGHKVTLVPGTQLATLLGSEAIEVNSAHHQAVDEVPEGVIINANAPDGVIEGIEYPAHPFCIGVQWHPEFRITEADRRLYAAFIAACGGYGSRADAA